MKDKESQYRAFSLIEILVAIAVILILAAIIFPVVSRARLSGHKVVAISNTRQILQAIEMYSTDHNDRLPYNNNVRHGYWMGEIGLLNNGNPQLKDPQFNTPEGKPEYESLAGYAINTCLRPDVTMKSIVDPSKTILIAPTTMFKISNTSSVEWHPVTTLSMPDSLLLELIKKQRAGMDVQAIGPLGAERYFGGGVYGFIDTHVKALRESQIEQMPDYDSCGFAAGPNSTPGNSKPTFVARQA